MSKNNFDHIPNKDIHELIEKCFIHTPKDHFKSVMVFLAAIIASVILVVSYAFQPNPYIIGVIFLAFSIIAFSGGLLLLVIKKSKRQEEAVIILIEHHMENKRNFIPKRSWKIIPKKFLEKHELL